MMTSDQKKSFLTTLDGQLYQRYLDIGDQGFVSATAPTLPPQCGCIVAGGGLNLEFAVQEKIKEGYLAWPHSWGYSLH